MVTSTERLNVRHIRFIAFSKIIQNQKQKKSRLSAGTCLYIYEFDPTEDWNWQHWSIHQRKRWRIRTQKTKDDEIRSVHQKNAGQLLQNGRLWKKAARLLSKSAHRRRSSELHWRLEKDKGQTLCWRAKRTGQEMFWLLRPCVSSVLTTRSCRKARWEWQFTAQFLHDSYPDENGKEMPYEECAAEKRRYLSVINSRLWHLDMLNEEFFKKCTDIIVMNKQKK